MTNETAVAEKKESVRTFDVALAEKLEENKMALPKNFNRERFVQNTLALLHDNPDLMKYKQSEIMMGLMKGATLGLDFMNKEAYLIPYKDQLQYQTDYRGAIKLAKQYSTRPIKDIYAKLVRDGDEYEVAVVDGNQTVNYKPLPFNDGEIKGAFAVVIFECGTMKYDEMSKKELENTRQHSKMKNGSAWTDYTGEMYKKTVLHRLCKTIDLNFENPDQRKIFVEDVAIETDIEKIAENEIEENENSVDFDEDVIDGEATDVE